MRRRIIQAFLILVAVALAGCSFFEPQVDPSRFYVLTATAEASGDVASRTSSGLTIGLGPIKLPDYLDRSQLVTRVGPNRVVFSDFERWAEPLDRNFSRIMIENLVALLNTEKVVSLPTFVSIGVQYEVPIEVQRFEAHDDGTIELAARWAIRAAADGKVLQAGESRIKERSGRATDEVVAALSRATGQLSGEIAAAIRNVSSAS